MARKVRPRHGSILRHHGVTAQLNRVNVAPLGVETIRGARVAVAALALPHLLVEVVRAEVFALRAVVVHGVAVAVGEVRVAAEQEIGLREFDELAGVVGGAPVLALLQGESTAQVGLVPGALLAFRDQLELR